MFLKIYCYGLCSSNQKKQKVTSSHNQYYNSIYYKSDNHADYTCASTKLPIISDNLDTKPSTSSDGYCLTKSPLALSITLITSRPESLSTENSKPRFISPTKSCNCCATCSSCLDVSAIWSIDVDSLLACATFSFSIISSQQIVDRTVGWYS